MRISYSRIECFKKCPYQYRLRYIEKLKTFFNCDPANALTIGTALHTGLEKGVKTAIKEYYAQYPVIDNKNIEEAIKLEAVIEKCRKLLPTGEYETKIESPEFIGFIDLLVEVQPNVYDMYDFKYSNNVENYIESGQLHVYKHFFEKLNPGKRIRKMYFLFAPKVSIRMKYKNKTNPRDEALYEFRNRLQKELDSKEALLVEIPYDLSKVEVFLEDAKKCINAVDFPKQPSRLCPWCEFKEFCEVGNDLEIDWRSTPYKDLNDYENKHE